MADVTVETFQRFLDDAWDEAPAGANTLRQQLRTFEKQVALLFSKGSLAAVSKNSASQSYRGPGLGSYTVVQIADVWRKLINLFDQCKAEIDFLITLNPPPTWLVISEGDSDPQVMAFMQWKLQPVYDYGLDATLLRLQPTLSPGPLTPLSV